jgi:hypothetical protein
MSLELWSTRAVAVRRRRLTHVRPRNAHLSQGHTSAGALYEIDRAKSDEEIRAIANTGGLVGVYAVPFFLSPQEEPAIESMLDHIDYIAQLVGWQHVGVGTDWPLQMSQWAATWPTPGCRHSASRQNIELIAPVTSRVLPTIGTSRISPVVSSPAGTRMMKREASSGKTSFVSLGKSSLSPWPAERGASRASSDPMMRSNARKAQRISVRRRAGEATSMMSRQTASTARRGSPRRCTSTSRKGWSFVATMATLRVRSRSVAISLQIDSVPTKRLKRTAANQGELRPESTSWGSLVRAQYRPLKKPCSRSFVAPAGG